ncbi:MAG: transposase [Planctomycetota bacterium]
MRRQRFSAEQWAAWLEEFENSDLSVTEFCELHDIGTGSFYQWRSKLAGQVPEFVPVSVAGLQPVEIDLPNGIVIRVPNDGNSIRSVLVVLDDLERAP